MTANTLEQHILSIVCSVFDAYSAVLFLPSENGEEHYLAASFSLGEGVEQGAMLSSGSLVDWIIRNRQQMLVPNFDQHKHKLGYYREGEEAGIKAFMGCPVPTGGALCVDSKRQYSFTDRDYKLLQLFAELVSRQQASKGRQEMAGDIPRYFAELAIDKEKIAEAAKLISSSRIMCVPWSMPRASTTAHSLRWMFPARATVWNASPPAWCWRTASPWSCP